MDGPLVRIVDAVMAEAARRSGAWLACRPGCWECCLGPVEISDGDARRLRAGYEALRQRDAARAGRLAARARAAGTGDDDPCPALDPESGTCELYEHRPVICRVFGPAVRDGDRVSACSLCYAGATEDEIAACAVEPPAWEADTTTVAACLAALP